MSTPTNSSSRLRVRWAAIGAAVAVTLGAGTIATVDAARSSGERNAYFPVVPCRLADTRPATQVGDRSAQLGPGDTATFSARGAIGNCTATELPADATALELNVTPVGPTDRTFLTFWPTGDRPTASSLNPEPGEPPTPNSVTVPLAPDGSFKVFNDAGNVHVAIDVVGFYADHDHDDRYALLADRVRAESTTGMSAFGGSGIGAGDPSSVDDVATATMSAPDVGSARLVVATATVHVNTSGDQSSTWAIDVTPEGGTTTEAASRSLYVVDGGLAVNPADTITLTATLIQEPGETHTFSVSGERTDGVPLANIRVDLTVISSPLDGTGEVPS